MIEILYSAAGVVAISAGSTQVYQLVKTGRSDELSIPTWLLWLATQSVTTVYALTLEQPAFLFVSSLWTLLYVVMLGLIVYYRRYPRAQPAALEYVEDTEPLS